MDRGRYFEQANICGNVNSLFFADVQTFPRAFLSRKFSLRMRIEENGDSVRLVEKKTGFRKLFGLTAFAKREELNLLGPRRLGLQMTSGKR